MNILCSPGLNGPVVRVIKGICSVAVPGPLPGSASGKASLNVCEVNGHSAGVPNLRLDRWPIRINGEVRCSTQQRLVLVMKRPDLPSERYGAKEKPKYPDPFKEFVHEVHRGSWLGGARQKSMFKSQFPVCRSIPLYPLPWRWLLAGRL